MAITFGQVKTWKAAPLGDAGDGLKADLRKLETSRDELEANGVPKSWTGVAAEAARGHRDSLVAKLSRHIKGKQQMQKALYTAEPEVEAIERLVDGIQDRAKTHEFTVGDDGSVTSTAKPPTFHNRYEAQEWGNSRQTVAQELADDITDALAKAAGVDATLTQGIPDGTNDGLDDTREQRGLASPEAAERWAQLTDYEKQAIIDQKIKELAEEYGVEVDDIVWDDTLGNTNGSWSEDEQTVRLNPDRLEDPDILHTVAHEMRHARQNEAIEDNNDFQFWWEDDPFDMHEEDGITEDQAEEWEENFDDYKSPDQDGFDAYYNQPVEKDARNSGRDYLNTVTPEELDRLLKESK